MNSKKKITTQTNFQEEHIILGIDEAGRGPVLGPMVYACCYWSIEKEKEILENYKFADSKTLKEEIREKLYNKMCEVKEKLLDYEAKIIHAQEISNKMLRRNKISLNVISTDAACELIRNALTKGVNVKEVYVDTVGKPEIYEMMLQKRFSDTDIKFKVTAKADSLFPVVSAASIVAKVNRDRTVNEWIFKESLYSGVKFENNFGCGYPGDPETKAWLAKNSDQVFGYPSIVRFSWKTTANLMKDKSKKVEWENYYEDEDEGKTREPFMDKFKKKKRVDFFESNLLIVSDLNLD